MPTLEIPVFEESEELRGLRRYLEAFNKVSHYWIPRGKTQAEPLCDDGLVYRDAKHVPKLKMRDNDPSCPRCRRQLGKLKAPPAELGEAFAGDLPTDLDVDQEED